MVKCLFYISVLLIFTAVSSPCQDQDSSSITVHFIVPKGWRKVDDSVFVRMNYNQEFALWYKSLHGGHMPWRADPKNIAVTCLWDFGIHDGSPVWVFADRLTEIKKGRIYSLQVNSTQYVIFVRTKEGVPIAYKFVIRRYVRDDN